VQANAPAEICRSRANLASVLWMRGDLTRSSAIKGEAEAAASRFGQNVLRRWLRADNVREQYMLGHWEEARASVEGFLAEVEAGSPHYLAGDCYMTRSNIRLGRDDVPGALADVKRALELARLAKDPQIVYSTLAASAHVLREGGKAELSAGLAVELLEQLRATKVGGVDADSLHVLAWTLSALGRGEELIDVLPNSDVPWVQAAAAFAAGDLRRAADVCATMGALTEEARDRLWLAEALIKQNRRAEADVELQRALSFYRSVGATRYIREGEALFAVSA